MANRMAMLLKRSSEICAHERSVQVAPGSVTFEIVKSGSEIVLRFCTDNFCRLGIYKFRHPAGNSVTRQATPHKNTR